MTTNINGFFPIKTATACKLKWAWSSIRLYDGYTCSCHRCNHHLIDITSGFNFHNTEDKIKQRKTMLSGEWPVGIGCEHCKYMEQSGRFSDRIYQNSIPGYPVELDTNRNEVHVQPTILEVYFDNKCNLACVYCNPTVSSKIANEINKFGAFPTSMVDMRRHNKSGLGGVSSEIYPTRPRHPEYLTLKQKFWQWMGEHSNSLIRFHIMGGEPLYQEDFISVINFFDKNPNPNLELNIISNLSIPPNQFIKQIDRVKNLYNQGKIKRFDVIASIDSWGEEQVYTRYGINLTWFENNMLYLLKQGKWLRLAINHTISALSIKAMPILMDKINEWRTRKFIDQNLGTVLFWDFLHPSIFPYDFWQEELKSTLEKMEDSGDCKDGIKMMQGVVTQLQNYNNDNVHEQQRLRIYLDEVDRRRGTNWRKVFPYFDI